MGQQTAQQNIPSARISRNRLLKLSETLQVTLAVNLAERASEIDKLRYGEITIVAKIRDGRIAEMSFACSERKQQEEIYRQVELSLDALTT